MAVFLFILIAILLYLKYADKGLFPVLFPITITAMLLRFLEQFILIDWLQIMEVHADGWLNFWIPIFADLTVWPISAYLFIQYMPHRHRLVYTLGWSAALVLYLQMLEWTNVIELKLHWHLSLTPLTVAAFFGLLYAVWRWLYPAASEWRAAHEP